MSKRFSLSNIPGRDDDVEESDIRQERELRRRIRESDPLYAQKRIQQQQKQRNDFAKQQQQIRFFSSKTSIPTPEQAALMREQESRALSPQGRVAMGLRQNAQTVYLTSPPQNSKKSFAKWSKVANESDVGAQSLMHQQQIIASTMSRAEKDPNFDVSEEIGSLIVRGIISPEAVKLFEEENAMVEAATGGGEDGAKKAKPTFFPDPATTHGFARRCIEVSRKTASIRYRDVCNAKSADDMGALGVDPEIMGNFGGLISQNNNNNNNENDPNDIMAQYQREQRLKQQRQEALSKIPVLPDNFDGVPVRGDSQARLIAYRKEKEKDKMFNAQRKLITEQARLKADKEMEARGVVPLTEEERRTAKESGKNNNNNSSINKNNKDEIDSDAPGGIVGGLASRPPTAEEIFQDCAVYLDDGEKNIGDPGYPLPMRLGTADRKFDSITFSGVDPHATDSEDLIILTTPQLRLASKCVLQCVFSIQAGDVRETSVPNVPHVTFVPVRNCPISIQKTHTLMMHEIKTQLRKTKSVDRNKFVVWTRVLLSRSTDPEDDIVAADDCRVEVMANDDDRLPSQYGTPSRRRGNRATGLPPTSPAAAVAAGNSTTSKRNRDHNQLNYSGGTKFALPDESNALLSGSATVDMMITSPNSKKVQNAKYFAVTGQEIAPTERDEEARLLNLKNTRGFLTAEEQKELRHQQQLKSRQPPSLPVIVRAPRAILVKPPERSLFPEQSVPTAEDIANEFKEFASTIRPILDKEFDPPGASRLDPDHVPTPPAELMMDDDDEDFIDDEEEEESEDFEIVEVVENNNNNNTQTQQQQLRQNQNLETRVINVEEDIPADELHQYPPGQKTRIVKKTVRGIPRKIITKKMKRKQLQREAEEGEAEKNKKKETGAEDWNATKHVASSLSMEDLFEPMRMPTTIEVMQLLTDNSPFESYEHAALTARALVLKLRDSAMLNSRRGGGGGGGGRSQQQQQQETSETEKMKFRLFEALDYVKQHVMEATTKMVHADSQVEFRFKMQESILKKESDGSLYDIAAKSVINADQRITMLDQRLQGDIADLMYTQQRQAAITSHIVREREERSASRSRHGSPNVQPSQQQSSSSGSGIRHHSPPGGSSNRAPAPHGLPLSGHSAFKPAPQPTTLPAQMRRPVQPVALKYAKPGEDAPNSLSDFLETQREGSVNRRAKDIRPEVPSPEKATVHDPDFLSKIKTPVGERVDEKDKKKQQNADEDLVFQEEEEEDDKPGLIASAD